MRILVGCLLLLTGCAHAIKDRYKADLDKWVGRDGHDLLLTLGAPDSLMDMDNGGKLLQWNDTKQSMRHRLKADGRVVSTDTSETCSTWFLTDKAGKITEYGFKGELCGKD